jgi:hypothetical protein
LSPGHIRAEFVQNRSNDILNRPAHVDNDRMLVGVGLLQDREVTVKEAREHRMFFACDQPRDDQRPFAAQINDAHLRPATGQEIAMTAPEHGTGDYATRTGLPTAVDPSGDPLEPGPLVTVIERMAKVRLGDIRQRTEFITFVQRPSESLGERRCDCCLPAARDACDNEDCRSVRDVGSAYG